MRIYNDNKILISVILIINFIYVSIQPEHLLLNFSYSMRIRTNDGPKHRLQRKFDLFYNLLKSVILTCVSWEQRETKGDNTDIYYSIFLLINSWLEFAFLNHLIYPLEITLVQPLLQSSSSKIPYIL